MKVTGLIMECNPFHEGHAYILREARRQTQADYIVVAMSGDYVQRGQPAVFDKYIRAEQVLDGGADLVLELPLYAACGSAEYFARGGISLLQGLGVITDLCFGSESGDTEYILRMARILEEAERAADKTDSAADPAGTGRGNSHTMMNRAEQTAGPAEQAAVSQAESESDRLRARYQEKLQAGLRSGLSFPAARAAAIPGFPSTPNNLLAVEYCRALLHSPGDGAELRPAFRTSVGDGTGSWLTDRNSDFDGGNSIRPHAISRIRVPSATERRRALLRQRQAGGPEYLSENLSKYLPEHFPKDLSDSLPEGLPEHLPETTVSQVPLYPLGPDDFSAALLYALRMQEPDLDRYADVTVDIADRIRRLLPRFNSFSSFCDLLKSKNLTYSRVSRSLLHILLQMDQTRLDTLQAGGMALYARPLAMNRSAAPLFSAIRKQSSLPFLSKLAGADALLSPQALGFLQEEIRAEDLYTLILGQTFAAAGQSADGSASGFPTGVPRAPQRKIVVKEYDR